ncbi:MAG: protein phosphatase 2C domain-containing protein [Hyphomicrobium sp.]|nr:protein phosphatase 2C domain-containing protein [Hyphomicrobium sp.]
MAVPSELEAVLAERMIVFDKAVAATRGARPYQEDTALLWPGEGQKASELPEPATLVAILADGMGGHAGGALASHMACETFAAGYAAAEGDTRQRLFEALMRANDAIAAKVADNPVLEGMGSTLVGVVFGEDGAHWVSVGDSPLLLVRRGQLALLNEDHSLAPELDRLAELGRMTHEDARRDPRRHMLRSAVTGEEIELVDMSRQPLAIEPGDYVILASDGLNTLDYAEIERIVAAYATDGAKSVAEALIRAVLAVKDPHQDNTTIVAVRPVERIVQTSGEPTPV